MPGPLAGEQRMGSLLKDIARLSTRIAEMDAQIDELSARIDERSNARSKLYRAMHRELLRQRETTEHKLNDLMASASDVGAASAAFAPVRPGTSFAYGLKPAADHLFGIR